MPRIDTEFSPIGGRRVVMSQASDDVEQRPCGIEAGALGDCLGELKQQRTKPAH